MKKRGDTQIFIIVGLLTAAFISVILLNISTKAGQGELWEEIYLAKKIGLQINALNSISDDAMFIRTDLSKHMVYLHENTIEVYKKKSNKFLDKAEDEAFGAYVIPHTFKNEMKYANPQTLYLAKKQGKIIISETAPDLTDTRCPDITTTADIETAQFGFSADDNTLNPILDQLKDVYPQSIYQGVVFNQVAPVSILFQSDQEIIGKFVRVSYAQNEKSEKLACMIVSGINHAGGTASIAPLATPSIDVKVTIKVGVDPQTEVISAGVNTGLKNYFS